MAAILKYIDSESYPITTLWEFCPNLFSGSWNILLALQKIKTHMKTKPSLLTFERVREKCPHNQNTTSCGSAVMKCCISTTHNVHTSNTQSHHPKHLRFSDKHLQIITENLTEHRVCLGGSRFHQNIHLSANHLHYDLNHTRDSVWQKATCL